MINPNRRQAMRSISSAFGALAFAAMANDKILAESPVRQDDPMAPKNPHFEARAKQVIFLSMSGAPSHVDTFDYKPQLQKDSGKPGKTAGSGNLLGSQWKFNQHGKSGHWISSLFPNLSKQADELCLLRGMHSDQPNHAQAQQQAHTGNFQFVRPSLGAWSLYGLGSENQDLPGFIVLNPGASVTNFGSSFLPAYYQGSPIRTKATTRRNRGTGGSNEPPKLPNIENPMQDMRSQRAQLDLIQSLNKGKLAREKYQPQVEGMIQSFELAFRMQTTMPQLLDISKETQATRAMYGIGEASTDGFGTQCLLARRMIEQGVRFVELSHGGWDHHNNLKVGMETQSKEIDKPIAGLLKDLKQRGLLKDTLVIWAGEFGRTPYGQGSDGRNHNNKGYTTWMAGGGVKGGFNYGSTDEYGYEATEGRMHTHDWHATILHAMGLDHEKLTYKYAGRDFRLTDVHGTVAKEIFA